MGEAQGHKSPEDAALERLVVEQGLATAEEVDDCLELKRERSDDDRADASLGRLLVDNGAITERQLARLKPKIETEAAKQPTQQVVADSIPGYKVIETLGEGAMATVYKAKQLSLDRLVAIKILPRKFLSQPEFVQRFYAEGRAAAKLNSPHIVGAIEVGQAGDFHYFVMEYVEGDSLHDEIEHHTRYGEQAALDVSIQVARALDHAHKAGLIHRDVKPKNVMITKEGVIKLADMGLARAINDQEAARQEKGKAFGTPYYISPEQIRGEEDVDFRADIYGLGATLYHAVTGQVPFPAPNPTAVMHKHLEEELVPPDHINPSLSAGIGEIIEVCMAKNRDERYNTTADLLQDLEAVAAGEPPLQARKKFDLSSLAEMEQNATGNDAVVDTAATRGGLAEYLESPLFWAAAAGWFTVLVLLVIVVLLLVS